MYRCIKEEDPPEWIRRNPVIEPKREYKMFIDLSANFPPIKSQGNQGVLYSMGYWILLQIISRVARA
jgi:hypothetical protein